MMFIELANSFGNNGIALSVLLLSAGNDIKLINPRISNKPITIIGNNRYVFENFIKATKYLKAKILVGIVLLKSAGMAKYMNENVAGIHVPDNLIEELKKDKEKTKSGQTGVEISARLIKDLKPLCQGCLTVSP